MFNAIGLIGVKVVTLAATNVARAQDFYANTLELEKDVSSTTETGFLAGGAVLAFREGYTPSDDPSPRITLHVQDANRTAQFLQDQSVTISDPVTLVDDRFLVGAFLDSEGNKLWFCSYYSPPLIPAPPPPQQVTQQAAVLPLAQQLVPPPPA